MDVGIGLPNSLLGVRGPDLVEWARRAERSGFSVLGDEMVQMIGQSILRTPEQIQETMAALAQQGCEELCLWPMAAGTTQVDRLAEAALA